MLRPQGYIIFIVNKYEKAITNNALLHLSTLSYFSTLSVALSPKHAGS